MHKINNNLDTGALDLFNELQPRYTVEHLTEL